MNYWGDDTVRADRAARPLMDQNLARRADDTHKDSKKQVSDDTRIAGGHGVCSKRRNEFRPQLFVILMALLDNQTLTLWFGRGENLVQQGKGKRKKKNYGCWPGLSL